MSITLDKTAREIATEDPSAISVFETLGIDYCWGGRKSLEQACADLHLGVNEVLQKLEEAATVNNPPDCTNWQTASLSELTQYIVSNHHKYVRQELVRLEGLCEKVGNKHGHAQPELKRIAALFLTMRDELSMHMTKEEQVLFPYIARLERAVQAQQPAPQAPFGTVANPIRVMVEEHDDAGSLMTTIRKLSNDYNAPAGACISYHAFYGGLKDFERDLHQHVHLENNILFRRALALEEQSSANQ